MSRIVIQKLKQTKNLAGKSAFLALVALLMFVIHQNTTAPSQPCSTTTAVIKGQPFTLEIADTHAKRAQGLSHRSGLANQSGMLFLFPNLAIHSFWMKDTLIDLDIIWLSQHKVVEIATLPAQSVDYTATHTPQTKSDATLELKSGTAQTLNLQKGDFIPWTPCQAS